MSLVFCGPGEHGLSVKAGAPQAREGGARWPSLHSLVATPPAGPLQNRARWQGRVASPPALPPPSAADLAVVRDAVSSLLRGLPGARGRRAHVTAGISCISSVNPGTAVWRFPLITCGWKRRNVVNRHEENQYPTHGCLRLACGSRPGHTGDGNSCSVRDHHLPRPSHATPVNVAADETSLGPRVGVHATASF